MPTVSQHYGHHAAPRTDKSALATRRAAAPVVLMVSGGADSTALLLMACTSKLDIQDGRGVAPIARERLHVLHVNHHLRGEASDGDEAFVRDLCVQYGLRGALCRGTEICSRTLCRIGRTADGGSYLYRAYFVGPRGNIFDECH